jgi:hypothetical protein
VGDYVLTGTPGVTIRDKTQALWEGPAQVIECTGPHVYLVEDVASKRQQTLHAQFLKEFRDSSFVVTEEVAAVAANSGRGYEILRFQNARELDTGLWQLQVVWSVDPDNPTWEPLPDMFAAVPIMVRSFITKMRPSKRKDLLQAQLRTLSQTKRAPRNKRRG